MESGSELERLQRWLQSELAEASILEDSNDRERRQIQIEIAISEVIRYRELVGSMALVSAPFVEREANVRAPSNSDVNLRIVYLATAVFIRVFRDSVLSCASF